MWEAVRCLMLGMRQRRSPSKWERASGDGGFQSGSSAFRAQGTGED